MISMMLVRVEKESNLSGLMSMVPSRLRNRCPNLNCFRRNCRSSVFYFIYLLFSSMYGIISFQNTDYFAKEKQEKKNALLWSYGASSKSYKSWDNKFPVAYLCKQEMSLVERRMVSAVCTRMTWIGFIGGIIYTTRLSLLRLLILSTLDKKKRKK